MLVTHQLLRERRRLRAARGLQSVWSPAADRLPEEALAKGTQDSSPAATAFGPRGDVFLIGQAARADEGGPTPGRLGLADTFEGEGDQDEDLMASKTPCATMQGSTLP
jgi:hypothetical protein